MEEQEFTFTSSKVTVEEVGWHSQNLLKDSLPSAWHSQNLLRDSLPSAYNMGKTQDLCHPPRKREHENSFVFLS